MGTFLETNNKVETRIREKKSKHHPFLHDSAQLLMAIFGKFALCISSDITVKNVYQGFLSDLIWTFSL